MNYLRISLLALFAVGLLLTPSEAKAEPFVIPRYEDQVVFGGTFTLDSGEEVDGDIVIFGGVVNLKEDSSVSGVVVMLGGNLTVSGTVQGDVVAIGGIVKLTETAIVYGDLIAPASVLQRDEGAKIFGQLISGEGLNNIENLDIFIPEIVIPDVDIIPTPFFQDPGRFIQVEGRNFFQDFALAISPVTQVLWYVFRIFSFSAAAILLVLFVPEHSTRTRKEMIDQPLMTGLVGFLTIILCIPVVIVLTLTIILIPASLLLVTIIFLGLIFGWIAFGLEVGGRINDAMDQNWSLPLQAGIGTFALTFVISSLDFIFWGPLAWLIGIGVASIGLGSVILTRFGVRSYTNATSNSDLGSENEESLEASSPGDKN